MAGKMEKREGGEGVAEEDGWPWNRWVKGHVTKGCNQRAGAKTMSFGDKGAGH